MIDDFKTEIENDLATNSKAPLLKRISSTGSAKKKTQKQNTIKDFKRVFAHKFLTGEEEIIKFQKNEVFDDDSSDSEDQD